MDPQRFDAVVRSLVTSPSRRRFATLLLGAGLSTFAASVLGRQEVDAKRKKRKKKKKPSTPQQSPPGCLPSCAGGRVCQNGACVCPSGPECSDACCTAGELCLGGVCQSAGTCGPTDSFCENGEKCGAGNSCFCLKRFVDEAQICGTFPVTCTACTTDAGCAGAGEFCALKDGPGIGDTCCDDAPANEGFCALPCPTP